MTLTETTNSKAQERIADFHYYLNEGMDVESAKKIILKSTCLNAVIKYVNNYK